MLSVLANHSVFNIGSPGRGKTHMIFSIIENCKALPNTAIENWNSVTYYELVEKIGQKFNQTLLWTVEEWSMLSDYHRELLMAIASKIQTDRNFSRLVSKGSYSLLINIKDCDLVLLVAIQPFKFRKLMKESDNWNSLASDRFLKFPFVNPLQKDTKKYPPKFVLPSQLNHNFKNEIPNKILVSLFEPHLTSARAELCALKYQDAWCKLNFHETFTETDALAFRTLYQIYLDLFPLMIYSTDPDREEQFHTGPFRIFEYFMNHFNQTVTVHEIERAFHMIQSEQDMQQLSERTIYRHLRTLEHHGIIQKNSPNYSLSNHYVNYFENYKENWK